METMNGESTSTPLVEMSIKGLMVDPITNMPIIILRDRDGQRVLPIWVGVFEANAIALQIENIQTPRPMTHDLLRDVIRALGGELKQVSITELRDDVFYAELQFADGTTVSARPSDAIALALRTETPIVGDESVLATAGISIPEEDEDEVEKFREFLDTISADDFAGSGGDEPHPGSS